MYNKKIIGIIKLIAGTVFLLGLIVYIGLSNPKQTVAACPYNAPELTDLSPDGGTLTPTNEITFKYRIYNNSNCTVTPIPYFVVSDTPNYGTGHCATSSGNISNIMYPFRYDRNLWPPSTPSTNEENPFDGAFPSFMSGSFVIGILQPFTYYYPPFNTIPNDNTVYMDLSFDNTYWPPSGTYYAKMCVNNSVNNVPTYSSKLSQAFTVVTPQPTATLTASPTTILAGQSTDVNWTSNNALRCSATATRNGTERTISGYTTDKRISGGVFYDSNTDHPNPVTLSDPGTYVFSLACTNGAYDYSPPSVTVIVNSAYTLTVNKSGTGTGTVTSSPAGINCGTDCTEGYVSGTSVNLTAVAAVGSTFAGWSGACTGTGSCTVTMTANKTVTATFTAAGYLLTVYKSGTGTCTVTSSPAGINCGVDCTESYTYNTTVTLSASAAAGSVFSGWSGEGCSGTGTCTVIMSVARTVTASFTANGYNLSVTKSGTGAGTVTSSPAGINCGADCNEIYAIGTTVTLTAQAASGSSFGGWSGEGCSGTGTCTVTMSAARSVNALFNDSTFYTLTVTKNGTGSGTVSAGGIYCGTDCTETFASGTSVNLSATPAVGSVFAGWSGACTGPGPCWVTMNSNKTVTATFNTNIRTLNVFKDGTGTGTVTSNPSGINCGTDCTETYSADTIVTLTATPATGSTFAGWTMACSGYGTNPVCNVNMNTSYNVNATFNTAAPIYYNLTVNASPPTYGYVVEGYTGPNLGPNWTKSYAAGSSITLTANVNSPLPGGYAYFSFWSPSCPTVIGTSCFINNLNSNTTITANYGFVSTYILNVTKTGIGQGTVTASPGSSCGTACPNLTYTYNAGTMVNLTGAVSGSNVFNGFTGTGCVTGSTSCNLAMNQNSNITADFGVGSALTTNQLKVTVTWEEKGETKKIELQTDLNK